MVHLFDYNNYVIWSKLICDRAINYMYTKTGSTKFSFIIRFCFYLVEGNILMAMADGVEKAQAILVCFSRKYKGSPCCQAGKFACMCKPIRKFIWKLIVTFFLKGSSLLTIAHNLLMSSRVLYLRWTSISFCPPWPSVNLMRSSPVSCLRALLQHIYIGQVGFPGRLFPCFWIPFGYCFIDSKTSVQVQQPWCQHACKWAALA